MLSIVYTLAILNILYLIFKCIYKFSNFLKPSLLKAIENRDLDLFLKAFEKAKNINIRDYHKKTALILASEVNFIEAVKLLLEKGADINAFDENNQTALVTACEKGNLEITNLLLDYKADVNIKTTGNNTALMHASKRAWVKIVKRLLDANANPFISDNKNNATALSYCCYYERQNEDTNNQEMVNAQYLNENAKTFYSKEEKIFLGGLIDNYSFLTPFLKDREKYYKAVLNLLIDAKADLNHLDKNKISPLLGATYLGNLEIVKTLRDAGASFNFEDKEQQGLLIMAACFGFSQNYEINMDPIFGLSFKDEFDLLIFFKRALKDKDLQKRHHKIKLISASYFGFYPLVQKLLKENLDVNYADEKNKATALNYSCTNGYLEISRLLIDAKADLNHEDAYKNSPISGALKNGHTKIVDLLIKAGAQKIS